MSVEVYIACDAAPDGEPCMTYDSPPGGHRTATDVRKALRRSGWHRTSDGRDICPDCWKAGQR